MTFVRVEKELQAIWPPMDIIQKQDTGLAKQTVEVASSHNITEQQLAN